MTSAAAPAPPIAAPMSPGTYLRKRREAAGVSLDLAALAFVPWGRPPMTHQGMPWAVRPDDELLTMVRSIAGHIDELEQDRFVVDSTFTAVLARIVPLDIEIYDMLVALRHGVDVPLRQICRECGCSWHRPCLELVGSIPGCLAGHYCAWSETDPSLCTACERKAATLRQETADAT